MGFVKGFLKGFSETVMFFAILSVPVSFILSLISSLATVHPCNTYAYYLPATYAMCHLIKERPEFKKDEPTNQATQAVQANDKDLWYAYCSDGYKGVVFDGCGKPFFDCVTKSSTNIRPVDPQALEFIEDGCGKDK